MEVDAWVFSSKVNGALEMLEATQVMQSYLAQKKTHPVLEWSMKKAARPFFRLQRFNHWFWVVGFNLDWHGRYYARKRFIFNRSE